MRPRTLTLVCHLLVDQAVAGRLVGHVEVVRTGEVVAITGADELVALVEHLRSSAAEPPLA